LVFQNAHRLSGSLGLLIVDIDHFKRYNDAHGHLAGDECLRRVALEIAECAKRPLDMVARYGGEEFVVLLPDTTPEGVRAVADRIRTLVEHLKIGSGAACEGVTVSIGIGYAQDVRNVAKTALFEIADRALYEAKGRGRNIVVLGVAVPPTVVLSTSEFSFTPGHAIASNDG
jgi:diguanylate cyclase (GGDEF)-like protein